MSAASTVLVAVGMEVPTATDKTGLLEERNSHLLALALVNHCVSWK